MTSFAKDDVVIFPDSITSVLPLERLEVGLPTLRRLLQNPTDPEIGALFLRTFDGDLHAEMARSMIHDPEGRRLLQERPRLDAASVKLDELARMPGGSLGRAYARHFIEQGVQPFATPKPIQDDADYITNRMRETHDLWHVLTGYGTDGMGELELQAFSFGNLRNPSSLLILAAVIPQIAREGVAGMPGWIAAAHRRGQASRALAGVFWEDRWEAPLTKLRAELCAPRWS
jgi:ubiquinone biosynthesis protein COQ4